jgi:hypothetical protein
MTHAVTPLEDAPDNSGSPKSPWLQLAEETKEREALIQQAKEINERYNSRAAEFAKVFYKEALDTQTAFSRKIDSLKEQGLKMSANEFEAWEDDYAHSIKNAKDELGNDAYILEPLAEIEQEMIISRDEKEINKTIEAQAGNFYHDRMKALREAIMQSGLPEAQDDLDYAKDFYSSVMVHLDYKYMPKEEARDMGEASYNLGRTNAHNNAIKHLNGINALARKYHTRPFTVRNFWPSDLKEKNRQTEAVARVMRYDRDIVEEFYANAFSSEVAKREYKLKRELY